MASQAQILANRENAQHSTGPKTEAGKTASKLNAVRHGLSARTLILAPEDAQAYQAFSASFLTELTPDGPFERQFAQTIIDSNWRLNQIPALEANLFALARLAPAPEHIAATADPLVKNALLDAHALVLHERQFRNLHIQEQRLHRVLNQAMAELTEIQQARWLREENDRRQAALKARKEQQLANPAPVAHPTPKPDGFVFSSPLPGPATTPEPSAHASERLTGAA